MRTTAKATGKWSLRIGCVAVFILFLLAVGIVLSVVAYIVLFQPTFGVGHNPDGPNRPCFMVRCEESINCRYEPQWTPDGSHPVFFSYLDHTIYSVKADGTDLRQIFKEKERYYRNYDPDVSPVGTDMVYATMRHAVQRRVASNYDIEVSSLSGNSRQRVTSGAEQDFAPAWSPRVDRIAFMKTPNRLLDPLGLYTIAPDGTREREVVSFSPSSNIAGDKEIHVRDLVSGPVWSPQGDLLAYVVYEREVDIETRDLITGKVLYSVGADGTGLTRIAEGETLDSLAWSPDGQWIAFTLREAWDRPFAQWMAHPDGYGAFKVADVSLAPGAQLQWSPDGSKLLLDEGPGSLLIIDPYSRQKDGSKLRFNAKYASWSPDGSKIAVVVDAGKNAMIVDASERSHGDRELLIIVDSSLMNTQPLVMVDKDRNIKAARGE